MGVFDSILQSIPEQDRDFFSRYPHIRTKVEELEASVEQARKAAEENDAAVRAWEDYLYGPEGPDGSRSGGVWDDEAKNFRPVIEAQQQLAAYKKRIADLENMVEAGTDMTFDEILSNLRERGFVTRDEIDPVLRAASSAVKHDDLSRVVSAFEYLYSTTADLPAKYLAEFGKPLDFQQYLDFLRKNNLVADPKRGYDLFVEPQRAEIRRKQEEEQQQKIREEIERAKQQGIEEGKRLASMGPTGLPIDQESSAAGYSPAVAEAIKKGMGADGTIKPPEDSKVGDGVRAAIAAKLYREGKLGGGVQ